MHLPRIASHYCFAFCRSPSMMSSSDFRGPALTHATLALSAHPPLFPVLSPDDSLHWVSASSSVLHMRHIVHLPSFSWWTGRGCDGMKSAVSLLLMAFRVQVEDCFSFRISSVVAGMSTLKRPASSSSRRRLRWLGDCLWRTTSHALRDG